MNKDFPSIYKKAKVAILMLCLFLMVVNTCPVRSLMTIASLPNIEYSKQSTGAQIFVNNDLLCSEGQVTNAVLLDFSKSYNSNLPFPFILSVLNLYLFLSVLSTIKFIGKDKTLFFTEGVPLFLKNQSIII